MRVSVYRTHFHITYCRSCTESVSLNKRTSIESSYATPLYMARTGRWKSRLSDISVMVFIYFSVFMMKRDPYCHHACLSSYFEDLLVKTKPRIIIFDIYCIQCIQLHFLNHVKFNSYPFLSLTNYGNCFCCSARVILYERYYTLLCRFYTY